MIRGSCSPTAGTCCWSWATAGTLSASGIRIGPVSVGTEASALLESSSRASRSPSSTSAPYAGQACGSSSGVRRTSSLIASSTSRARPTCRFTAARESSVHTPKCEIASPTSSRTSA